MVDDSPINQIILTELLSSFNLHVDTADNGLEAVECCEKAAYDLIFMDLEMPEMNGHEATVKIRKTLKFYNPIIALTAHEKDAVSKTLREAGFSGFLKKPIEQPDLFRLLYSLSPDLKPKD